MKPKTIKRQTSRSRKTKSIKILLEYKSTVYQSGFDLSHILALCLAAVQVVMLFF